MNIMKTGKTLSQGGFTLIEAIIAMGVLAVGIIAMYSMQVTAIDGNHKAYVITTASNWAATEVEDILSRPYDDLEDVDADGTNQDSDEDGIDDDGGNFGLDDVTDISADGTLTSSDGQFTIFWNVAEDTPMPRTKTIRVHVQDEKGVMQNIVVFDYIKQEGV